MHRSASAAVHRQLSERGHLRRVRPQNARALPWANARIGEGARGRIHGRVAGRRGSRAPRAGHPPGPRRRLRGHCPPFGLTLGRKEGAWTWLVQREVCARPRGQKGARGRGGASVVSVEGPSEGEPSGEPTSGGATITRRDVRREHGQVGGRAKTQLAPCPSSNPHSCRRPGP